MKKILAALFCFCCSSALAQTAQELIDNGKNSENVTTFGMGYNLNQYSPLAEITKSNIKRLVPVWSTALSNDAGELAQPTIYDGVMYVVNGNWTFALDVATGQQIWRTPVEYDRASVRISSSGVLMRGGATIYNGKLFRETLDSHVIALDMKTGKQIWKQKFADFKEGYTGIIAPLVANGRWRPHHPRLPRWLGPGNRQATVAPLHNTRTGRARLRDLAQGHSRRL
jgi:alcohol dehydrogenase (cytochrome c)